MRGDEQVLERMTRLEPTNVAVSSVVLHELFYGAHRSARVEANLARVYALRFPVLDFDQADAEAAGRIRADLAARGTPVGPYDVLIAGQGLARDLTVVTRNVDEFRRVMGLRIEDWEDR